MNTEQKDLDAADFAAILSTTLAMATEAGLSVGVKNRPASLGRAAGLLIFVEGLRVADDGRLVDHADPPQRVDDRAAVEPVGIGEGVEHGGR